MRVLVLTIAGLLTATSTLANDQATCAKGIAMIKAAIARPPAEPILTKVKAALRVAEREMGEGEFDECVEAVDDAQRLMK